ncbi:MAG: hypothetical protein ACRDMH_08670 [Solirubrobacterales bacterium]
MRIRRHLSYANVVATLALLLALGGGAYAIDKVNSHEIVNGTIKSVDLKNRKAVRAADVKRNALQGAQIDEAALDATRFAPVVGDEPVDCDLASSVTLVNCASASVRLSARSRVLIIATGNQETVSGGSGAASCRIRVDNVAESLAVSPGEQSIDNTSGTATNGFARTLVTRDPLVKGRHTVALACKELAGNVRIDVPTIAAIAIGTG